MMKVLSSSLLSENPSAFKSTIKHKEYKYFAVRREQMNKRTELKYQLKKIISTLLKNFRINR